MIVEVSGTVFARTTVFSIVPHFSRSVKRCKAEQRVEVALDELNGGVMLRIYSRTI